MFICEISVWIFYTKTFLISCGVAPIAILKPSVVSPSSNRAFFKISLITLSKFAYALSNLFWYWFLKGVFSCYIKSIKFCDFWPFSGNFVPTRSFKTTISGKYIPMKCFTFTKSPNIWSKYDIDTPISHISTYSNKIRVFVTYLITTTSI